jgi:hypothetical protein
MITTTEQYHAAERALFALLHVNHDRVSHLSTDSIYKAARSYVAAVDAIDEAFQRQWPLVVASALISEDNQPADAGES